jgi:hypothetical protein
MFLDSFTLRSKEMTKQFPSVYSVSRNTKMKNGMRGHVGLLNSI